MYKYYMEMGNVYDNIVGAGVFGENYIFLFNFIMNSFTWAIDEPL